VEWQPAIEATDELKSKQDDLKSAFISHDLQESCIRKMMGETYCIQRATINKGSTVKTLMEEWPFLFEAVHLFDHTCTLVGFPVQTKLPEELAKKGNTIKDFLNSKGMKIELSDDPVQLISGIANFFKETPDHLYCQNEVGFHLFIYDCVGIYVYLPPLVISLQFLAELFLHISPTGRNCCWTKHPKHPLYYHWFVFFL